MADECEGLCDIQALSINIVPNLVEYAEEETFLHELLHACASFAGIQDGKKYTEEEFVGRLSPILHTVMRDNGCWNWST